MVHVAIHRLWALLPGYVKEVAVHGVGGDDSACFGCRLQHAWQEACNIHCATPLLAPDATHELSLVAFRAAVPVPSGVKGLPAGGQVDAGEVPSLQQLGFGPEAQAQARLGPLGAAQLRGGESQALQHVQVRGQGSRLAGAWHGWALMMMRCGPPACGRVHCEVHTTRRVWLGVLYLALAMCWRAGLAAALITPPTRPVLDAGLCGGHGEAGARQQQQQPLQLQLLRQDLSMAGHGLPLAAPHVPPAAPAAARSTCTSCTCCSAACWRCCARQLWPVWPHLAAV